MSTLKTSDLEEMTGLSQRYWQRSYAFLRVEHLHRALARNVVKLKKG